MAPFPGQREPEPAHRLPVGLLPPGSQTFATLVQARFETARAKPEPWNLVFAPPRRARQFLTTLVDCANMPSAPRLLRRTAMLSRRDALQHLTQQAGEDCVKVEAQWAVSSAVSWRRGRS